MKNNQLLLTEGAVFAVPLENKSYAFGVLSFKNEVTFYDFLSKDNSPPEDLIDKNIAFRVPVAIDELNEKTWPIVGTLVLNEELKAPGKYLNKPIGSTDCFVYQNGKKTLATKEEIESLEVLTVWFSSHIEDRLNDYFNGKPSKYDLAIRRQLML